MAISEASKEALWLRGLIGELGLTHDGIKLYYNSQGTIHLAKNKIYHTRIKHINVHIHRTRGLVESEEIKLQKVHIYKNTAYMLTKIVTMIMFKYYLDLANILD